MKLYIYLFFLTHLSIYSNNIIAQNIIDKCGSDFFMQELLKDSTYRLEHEKRQQIFKAKYKENASTNRKRNCDNLITLPIAVHFIDIDMTLTDVNCLTQMVEEQINILNDDFQGKNADLSNWLDEDSQHFPDTQHGEACIEFCLATMNHPEGFDLIEGEYAITINQFNKTKKEEFNGYINITVESMSSTTLGWSPLGGDGYDGFGLFINLFSFGRSFNCGNVSPDYPYDLGRTLTHEMAHYLNLKHIWGHIEEECVEDDEVSDTPISYEAIKLCLPFVYIHNVCNTKEMLFNYMSYSSDQCLYMFTAGQVDRMENWVNINMQDLINNAYKVCGICPINLTLDANFKKSDLYTVSNNITSTSHILSEDTEDSEDFCLVFL